MEANPSGGTLPYEYQWYKAEKATDPFTPVIGETSKIISGISKGFYRVWIKDANSCKDSLSAAWYLERGYDDINVPDSIHINSPIATAKVVLLRLIMKRVTVTATGGLRIAGYYLIEKVGQQEFWCWFKCNTSQQD